MSSFSLNDRIWRATELKKSATLIQDFIFEVKTELIFQNIQRIVLDQ